MYDDKHKYQHIAQKENEIQGNMKTFIYATLYYCIKKHYTNMNISKKNIFM